MDRVDSIDVLHVSKFYHPVRGGIEKVAQDTVEHLPPEYRPSVLTAETRGFGTREEVNGVPVTRTGSAGVALSVPLSPTFIPAFGREATRADIIHLHLPNPLAVVACLVSSSADPLVVTYHSDIVRQQRALRLYSSLLRRVLERANRIITTSPNLIGSSPFLHPHAEKCRVVPIGIDTDVETAKHAPDQIAVDAHKPVYLFVGRLVYYKGVEYLVEAFDGVDGTLLIVGDGPLRDSLERRIQRSTYDADVRFLGEVDDVTLRACYETADVFVLPSVASSEAFGIVQLEAMVRGLPVINTNLDTGVPWVSKDGETGITVPPADSERLAKAIKELGDDEGRRRKLGEAAKQRVRSEFTQERMISRTVDVYGEVY
jgi:rhamnosyl/mannosyltransferase